MPRYEVIRDFPRELRWVLGWLSVAIFVALLVMSMLSPETGQGCTAMAAPLLPL